LVDHREKKKENSNLLKTKSIIAVGSGKGGVGKSTVTVNFALSMATKGKRVGLLDADIYGPNIPLMLGLENVTASIKSSKIIPVERFNLKIMSVGFITQQEKALIWRGPLANKLIEQFLTDVDWGELDLLIIDLPPGTGDVPLSIIQKTNLTGGIIVTTSQEASIADVKKMANMFQVTNTRIFGVIENMKYLVCPDCQKKISLYPNKFKLPEMLAYPVLAEFPFEPSIGIKDAKGTPFYLNNQENLTVKEFNKLSDTILTQLNQ
jgi:ATP-binding protein involved in chromosome partitioning